MPEQDLSHTNRPTTPIIEDRVSDSEDESKTKAPQIVPSIIQSSEQVKSPKHSVQPLETSISATTPKLASPKSASSGKKILTQSKPVSITAVRPVSAVVPKSSGYCCSGYAEKMEMKTKMPNTRPSILYHKCINDPKKGNPQHTLKDKGVIDSGCSRPMTRNMSYLSDFEELNGGYVAFGGNPKGEFEDCSDNSINEVNAAGSIVPTVGQNSLNSTNTFSIAGSLNAAASPTYGKSSFIDASQLPDDLDMSELEDITYFDDENDVGAEADFNNLETSITEEPKRVHQALKDPSWIEVIQEELLQFKMQKVWVLVDLPHGKRAIGTKWVFRNRKDERGIVIRNKARLVAQGHTQEEGINYEEVFAPVARIKAIRLFLAYASFMSFMVYQMDVKSAFIYGTIEEEVYLCHLLWCEDPDHPDKVYKV
nr:putative ribonuclease H-like domain-containing protein [Tanacetum cinerariifolium]